MIERVIEVAGKQVAFKSSAAVPRLYRAKFKRDIFKDFSKLEQSYKGIYLDDGTLVGHLLPAIDGGLADYSIRTRRGNR